MRFSATYLQHGDTRQRTFFALFPVTIWFEKHRETRWLERVTILEEYWDYGRIGDSCWRKKSFIDSPITQKQP
jgi:hypothetical protein